MVAVVPSPVLVVSRLLLEVLGAVVRVVVAVVVVVELPVGVPEIAKLLPLPTPKCHALAVLGPLGVVMEAAAGELLP